MAINLASKFAQKVDERFRLESLTDAGVNKEFEWVGVNAINILTLTSVALNDYDRTATGARFGANVELQDTKQTMTLSKDRGNSIVVDKGNNLQQHNLKTAGRVLAMQTSEIVIPEVDTYRLATMSTATPAAHTLGTAASTSSNVYTNTLAMQEALSDDKVPLSGRVLFVTPAFANLLKTDANFIKASDLAYTDLKKGQIGEVDGAKIVVVPSSYFPTSREAILVHKSVVVAAEQLNDYKVHMDPPGISGMQIDFRVIYDAFARTPKVNGLACRKTAA